MLVVEKWVAGTKVDNALNNALLPQNNNRAYLQLEGVHSTTVVVHSKGEEGLREPVGFGLVYRYSPNQAYCSLISIAKEFEKGYVNVEYLKNVDEKESGGKRQHNQLKIVDIHPMLPDLSGLPQYFSAFAEPLARPLLQCITDQMVADCFGETFDMEMRRNLTVDLYDSESGKDEHPDQLWRDFSGFLVADRFRYIEVDIKCASLLSALHNGQSRPLHSNIQIQPLSPSTRSLFHDYDQTISLLDRTEYLDFLLDLNGIQGMVAIDEHHRPVGCSLRLFGRVLQCYAEEESIAAELLHSLFSSSTSPHDSIVSIFLRVGSDHSMDAALLPVADNIRRVRRFHSRIVPNCVKWAKVFSLNIGAHLF